jgi:hypothetical protein
VGLAEEEVGLVEEGNPMVKLSVSVSVSVEAGASVVVVSSLERRGHSLEPDVK